ncbi:hypothetical protein OBBRIDRAFT_824357 [Obba rivulosa]|uniref:Uncharacterized protein n=1 Tax=Obba rivulosa TaxID=1052685 RepID=A0A8E2B2X7_9APHY|nr:hypothetical protein OBBRIDRAFT_824357 [Obba rivulosa]
MLIKSRDIPILNHTPPSAAPHIAPREAPGVASPGPLSVALTSDASSSDDHRAALKSAGLIRSRATDLPPATVVLALFAPADLTAAPTLSRSTRRIYTAPALAPAVLAPASTPLCSARRMHTTPRLAGVLAPDVLASDALAHDVVAHAALVPGPLAPGIRRR